MNPMTRTLLTAFVAITVAIGAGVYFSSRDGGTEGSSGTRSGEAQGDGEAQVVRENSHRLSSAPDSDVTLSNFSISNVKVAARRSPPLSSCERSTASKSPSSPATSRCPGISTENGRHVR